MINKIHLILLICTSFQQIRAYEPIFDEFYDTYPKEDELNFGYDKNKVCGIKRYGDVYYGGLYDAYSFMKAPYTELSAISKDAQIMNCFNYKGYSYIIYKEFNTTSMMRARIIRNFKFEDYKYYYDHILSKLYVLNEMTHRLSLVKFDILEKYWTEYNKTNNNERLYFDRSINMIPSTLDFFIINDTIYSIVQGDNTFNKIIKQNIYSSENEVIVEKTVINNFDFIPFPSLFKISAKVNGGFMKVSFNEGFPAIELMPPSTKIIAKLESLDLKWAIILYIFDFIFIIITLVFLKFFYRKYQDYKYAKEMKIQERDRELLRNYSGNHSLFSHSSPYGENSITS